MTSRPATPGDAAQGRAISPTVRTRTTFAPGALTALLADLARAPEASGWELPASPGERVGRFEIVRELGRGGFGVVYEARDLELGRSVAFKAIRSAGPGEARDLRALAEAEAAARLAHPNIVHLYDVGRCERGPFLILELLRGETLDERITRGPLPLREALRVAAEVARGVAHAHSQGVVHRDLKPGNVFLCADGQVKVLDFGLAHVFGKGGVAGGTPAYMAPEQAAGESGDERADVYALGVIVHELVTGERPFQDGARGVPAEGKAPPLPGAPAALARLVSRTLARDPGSRPASAVEVHAQLAAFQKALEPRRLLWAGWGLAIVALLVAAGFALRARPLPPGRLLTAMADLENETGEPDLDGVAELLRVGLEQSRRVSLVARSRLVNALRDGNAPAPDPIDEARARTAALRAGAQVLILSAVRRVEHGYDVTVRAVDLGHGETIVAVREAAVAKATLPAALDRLTNRLRRALREDAEDRRRASVAVTEVAPANAEALRWYAEARRLDSSARFDEALEAFRRAAAADPGFPLAHLEILEYSRWKPARLDPRSYPAHEAALRSSLHRLPEKERMYAEYLLGGDRGSLDAQLAFLDRIIEAFPEDPRAYVEAGRQLLTQRADLEAARPYLERAIVVAPLSEGIVVDFLRALGRLDDALARARGWTETFPSWVSYHNLSFVHRERGEIAEALEAARRANAFGSPVSLVAFADADVPDEADAQLASRPAMAHRRGFWLALRGRVREALALHDAGVPPPEASREERADYQQRRPFLLLSRGDPDAVWREVEAQLRVGGAFFFCHAWALAAIGAVDRADPITWAPHDGHVCWRTYRALRMLDRGSPEDALREFSRIHTAMSHLHRAEILLELGRHRDAVEAAREYRLRRGINDYEVPLDPWAYPRSLYLEASALERLGERDEARAVLDRLLRLWSRADPDLPLLRDAKALERLLSARGR